jgi:hypothetical protein
MTISFQKILLSMLAFSFMIITFASGDVHATDFGPYKGKIIDADTKAPIEGVVILVEWWEIPFFGGPKYIDAQETLTDKNGMFTLKGIWVLNPMKHMGADVIMTIFKSGYQFHQWLFHNWKENRPEIDKNILNIEDGKPVIMLKQLAMEERREQRPPTPSTNSPLNKIQIMLNEINKNEISLGADPYDIWRGEKVYEKK